MHSVELLNEQGELVDYVNVGDKVRFRVTIDIHANLPSLVFGYMFKDRLGQPIFGTNTHHLGLEINELRKGEQLILNFEFPANLGIGSYSVTTGLHEGATHVAANYEWRDLALMFNVINVNRGSFVGVSWIPPQVEMQR